MNISDNSLFQIPDFSKNAKNPAFEDKKIAQTTPKIHQPPRQQSENSAILQDILAKSQEIIAARNEAEATLRSL